MATSSSSRSGSRDRALVATIVLSAAASAAALGASDRSQSSGSPGKAEPSRLTLGVLRHDGFLSPFASFENGTWSVPWPDPTHVDALPIGLRDIPKKWWGAAGPDAPWTAWLMAGGSRPLKLTAPAVIPVFCSRHLAIGTDYWGGPRQPGEPTVAKDGLAIAGGASLLPIESVPVDSPDAREMVRTITENFDKEEKFASTRFTHWKHPIPERARREAPIHIEAFYRASETTKRGTWTTSYVEAVRTFPPGPKDNGCGLITFARAWVHQQPGAKPRIDLGARVTYCDRANVAFMLPFGRLLLRDEAYWVYQTSSWRDELYTVARVEPKDIRPVVTVSGGMCFR
jgi:hypothetical protein